MIDQDRVDAELARRYRWFCEIGWNDPTLNDPLVIHGKATPGDIDRLIIRGMKRWPSRTSSPPSSPFVPDEAA